MIHNSKLFVAALLLLSFAACTPEKDTTPNPHNLRGSSFSHIDSSSGVLSQYLFDNTITYYTKIVTIDNVSNTTETGDYTLNFPDIAFSGNDTVASYHGTFADDDHLTIGSDTYNRN